MTLTDYIKLVCANCLTPLIEIKGFRKWKQFECDSTSEICDTKSRVLVEKEIEK